MANPSNRLPLSSAAANAIARSRSGGSANAKMVEKLVQPEMWCMFDTIRLGATAGTGVDYTFATLPSSVSFFNSHTMGANGKAVTSMTTSSGYVDFPSISWAAI